MSMQIHKLTTYLQAQEACTLFELRQASSPPPLQLWEVFDEKDPF